MAERNESNRGDESLFGDAGGYPGDVRGTPVPDDIERTADVRELGSGDAESEDPVVIRAEIRETRGRMSDTLEQIGERLNPQNIKEQVKDNIREATIGKVENMARNAADRVNETGESIVDTIRRNPIPALMIGVGLGWLIAGSRQSKQRSWSSGYRGQEYRGYGGYRGEYRGYGGSEYAGMPYASEQEEPGTMDRVMERASELGDDVKERAGELADRAKDVASDVADRAQNVASSVADQTRVQAHRLQDQYQESPLAMGAVSLALGIAAGLALPATDREISLVGDARDRVVDRARGVARETKDKVEHVAERVIDQAQTTAKQAAKEEGLTS